MPTSPDAGGPGPPGSFPGPAPGGMPAVYDTFLTPTPTPGSSEHSGDPASRTSSDAALLAPSAYAPPAATGSAELATLPTVDEGSEADSPTTFPTRPPGPPPESLLSLQAAQPMPPGIPSVSCQFMHAACYPMRFEGGSLPCLQLHSCSRACPALHLCATVQSTGNLPAERLPSRPAPTPASLLQAPPAEPHSLVPFAGSPPPSAVNSAGASPGSSLLPPGIPDPVTPSQPSLAGVPVLRRAVLALQVCCPSQSAAASAALLYRWHQQCLQPCAGLAAAERPPAAKP